MHPLEFAELVQLLWAELVRRHPPRHFQLATEVIPLLPGILRHSINELKFSKYMYLQDDTINAFPLAFLNVYFGAGGLPEINMANVSRKLLTPAWTQANFLLAY